jgi:hypothetical protein
MKRDLARRKALADACAGVIGSLVSMLVFYPVDVWKTNLQAGKRHLTTSNHTDTDSAAIDSTNVNQLRKLSQLFRGLPYKIAHTTVSSFTYFFVYSLVQTKYFTYRNSLRHSTAADDKRIPAITKLVLAAFAAVINTGITLPLDTLSSRMQTAVHHVDDENGATDSNNANCHQRAGRENGTNDGNQRSKAPLMDGSDKSQLYISSPEKFKFSFSINLQDEAFTQSRQSDVLQKEISGSSSKYKRQLQSILSLWNGLLPAILLCSNPAIQYTLYDTFKGWLLLHRQTHQLNSEQQHAQKKSLSMTESFLFGLISKFVATISTYPLIRAKVMMMVAPTTTPASLDKVSSSLTNETTTTDCNETKKKSQTAESTSNKGHHIPKSLVLLLLYIFRQDGWRGLYRGCSLQLLHTVLKSAMLLMVRERITFVSRHFFRVVEDG